MRRLRRLLRAARRPAGRIDLGDLRRLRPVSDRWGVDRGEPADRRYIEAFLRANAAAIRGDVLEVKEDLYASRLGGGRVRSVTVLHYAAGNADATLVADLTRPDAFPLEAFDAFICTQTLQYVRDLPAAARSCHRALRPGGVLLASAPALSRLDPDAGSESAGEFWRFTEAGLASVFEPVFGAGNVHPAAFGNVLAAVALLHGLAVEDLTPAELDEPDPAFPVLVTLVARKADSPLAVEP